MRKKNISCTRLFRFAGNYRYLTYAGCLLSGLSSIAGLLPYIFIWLSIKVLFSTAADISMSVGIVQYGLWALGLTLISMLLYFGALMCTHLSAFRISRNMKSLAMHTILKFPLGYFEDKDSGKLRKQVDDNADLTETLLAHNLPDMVGAIVTPVAVLVFLAVFDWKLGLLCLVPFLLSFIILMGMMSGDNAKSMVKYQASLETMSSCAVEYVRCIPIVKTFQQTVYSFKDLYEAINSYGKWATEYSHSCRFPYTCFTTVINGFFALLIPVGILLLRHGMNFAGTLLDIVFYILFTPVCTVMMNKIMYATESFQQVQIVLTKFDQLTDCEPLRWPRQPLKPQELSIHFENVSFAYPATTDKALDNVSLSMEPGKTYALVGASGSGKTTAAALIPRFWDPGSGRITIGGIDIRDMSEKDLLDGISFVFQDNRRFKTTIRENLLMAKPDATEQELKHALAAAQCDEIIANLPYGIDTALGSKGTYLSGGETQRIALARAILKDAPIVVLDEATAFADPENEYRIQKAFETLVRDKTVLMIAHRLSSVKNADEIFVLDHGRLVERGTHKELLEAKKEYARLYEEFTTSLSWKVAKEA